MDIPNDGQWHQVHDGKCEITVKSGFVTFVVAINADEVAGLKAGMGFDSDGTHPYQNHTTAPVFARASRDAVIEVHG